MDTSPDLVTVVVPTFNGGRYLDATLGSLGAQTYPHLEVIVVDDGSLDDSAVIARRSGFVSAVLTQPNLGVAVARNRGLARARGRWVGFVDQDDLWRSDRVANLVDYAVRHNRLAVASTERRFALASQRAALQAVGDGRHTWPEEWIADGCEHHLFNLPADPIEAPRPVEEISVSRLLEGAAMLTTSVLYDRETAIAAGGFAPHARALDDHILNLNVARISGPIHRVDTRDLLYRVHPASTSTVSPMSGPFLSAMAGVRLGGVFPATPHVGSNVTHLLRGLPDAPISPAEQVALLLLTVPRRERLRWLFAWAKHSAKDAITGRHR